MNITGNTILITGGTSGIGRALAEELHAKGNQLVIAGRRQNLLNEVTSRNEGMIGIVADLGSSDGVESLAQQVLDRFPSLNVLINNAGIAGIEDYAADPVDLERAYKTITTNITSVVQLSAALLPRLRSQPKATLAVCPAVLLPGCY